MATVRVYVKLKYEGTTAAFYDISHRVNYEALTWESNSEGTSAVANFQIWTILPKSALGLLDHTGATEADKINAAILDEAFVLEIPQKTEIRILDTSTAPDTVLFAGYVTRVSTKRDGGAIIQDVECADNTAMLEEMIIADFYASRDSRDVDIIYGGTSTYTSAASLPSIVGQVDGLQVSSEATGGSLTDGTYEIRMQARSTTLTGRGGASPQLGPVTSPISITISGGTSTQRLKVKWKNANNANRHLVYVKKTSVATTEYLAKTANTNLTSINITNAVRASNVTTITTASAHGISAGDPIIISIPQTAGFSVSLDDYVVAKTASGSTITYDNPGANGSATITGAKFTSGSAAYVDSLSSTGSPVTLTATSTQGWVDGEVYTVGSNNYRLGVTSDNTRGWQYPISMFKALFDGSKITSGELDVSTYISAVDTQVRFSPYLPESDTALYEQFGGRSVRNALDYISQKTGGEFWVDKGTLDGSNAYKAYLRYGAKTPQELAVNGLYDGNLDGWTTASGFVLGTATSGPYSTGYSVSSSTSGTSIDTATASRVATVPGRKYFFSVRGKVSGHQNRWGAYVVWYNSSGTEIHSDHMGNLSGAPVGTWHRIWKIIQAPANAAYFGLRGQCTTQQHGSASFTDWSAIRITGAMGYGDAEDTATYAVPIYEMEVPESPVESGAAANRLHLYAVFRTRDSDGNKIALVDALGNPVKYVDYDFVPGIWATNGKIIETTKTDDKVETLADARLSASSFWKENGLPIESYTFEMRPWDASGSIYPVPEVGDVIPFIWTTMDVAKPLIVKSVSARMSGMDVVYKINVGGDIRLQRSAFIRISETLKDLSDVNPIPPTPSAPTEISATANIKSATVTWSFDNTLERNKNLSSFDIQRQDGIFKAITNVQRSGSTVTITTDGEHGMVNGDKVRVELDAATYSTSTNKIAGDWSVTSTTTNSFTYTSVTSGTIASTLATGWAIYNFCEFRTVQNTKSTYTNDNGLSEVLNYRYQVRALTTDNTAGSWTEKTEPVTPSEIVATIPDGSITAAKLISSLKAIEIISAASLPTLPSTSYTAGTIVYHLGGTPPGLRRVAVGGATWENAVGSGDIIANSITAGLISTAGLDASVIKSGALVIDSRFGVGNLKDVSYKQQALTTATLTTTTAHGYAAGNTVKVTNVGAPFNGSFTILASPAPTSTKFSYTVGTSATVAETAVTPYGAALVNSGTNAITSTNFTVSNAGVITAASGTIGGWTLDSDRFTNLGATKYAGLIDTATDAGLAFFAGASATSGTGATFTVTNSGAVTAANMSITGGPSGGNVINISSGQFSVDASGYMNAKTGKFSPGSGTSSSGQPALLLAGSSATGDIAVTSGASLNIGHTTAVQGTNGAFTERMRIDSSGNVRIYDGYLAVGRSTDNFLVTSAGAISTVSTVTATGDIRTSGSLVSYGADVFIDQSGTEYPLLTFRNDGGSTVYGTLGHNGSNFTLSDAVTITGAVITSGEITTTSGSGINIITSNGIRVGAIDGVYFGTDATAPNLYFSTGWKLTGTTAAASTVDAVFNGASSTAALQTLVRVSSSERYKENISYLDFPLEEIVKLQPAEYQYRTEWRGTDENDEALPAQMQVGIIAESAVSNPVWKKLVVNDDIGRPDSWRYSLMGPILLSGVRQLNEKIADLEARIAELES